MIHDFDYADLASGMVMTGDVEIANGETTQWYIEGSYVRIRDINGIPLGNQR